MKNWTDNLTGDVYNRLGNCRTVKNDLESLVNAKWLSYKESGKDKDGFTKEDALISILELLDCNGFYVDLSRDEYNELCK
ncbi:MAG: hypothetical protein GX638_10690 [Crenarchaeota archaeon]|nr:hypothetical protein [Thermoproteota archaeon]